MGVRRRALKPAPFEYHDPTTVAEAVAQLRELGDEAKLLAGGQSLVPLMNLRLARPSALVDLGRIDELKGIDARGSVRVGAMVRHAEVLRSTEIATLVPLLHEATRFVGHAAIRSRGTFGGSIAHADPVAEGPLVALALDAELVAIGPSGRRSITAADFFQGTFTTALEEDEILVEVVLASRTPSSRWGFSEIARSHGDFALVAAAVSFDEVEGVRRDVRVAVAGAADRPTRVEVAEDELEGAPVADPRTHARAVELVRGAVCPTGDAHASADYRKRVAGVLVGRALQSAASREQDVA